MATLRDYLVTGKELFNIRLLNIRVHHLLSDHDFDMPLDSSWGLHKKLLDGEIKLVPNGKLMKVSYVYTNKLQ